MTVRLTTASFFVLIRLMKDFEHVIFGNIYAPFIRKGMKLWFWLILKCGSFQILKFPLFRLCGGGLRRVRDNTGPIKISGQEQEAFWKSLFKTLGVVLRIPPALSSLRLLRSELNATCITPFPAQAPQHLSCEASI